MKLFIAIFITSALLLRCQCKMYDELDFATAKYAMGYVPNHDLMQIVHNLTPDARKKVQILRQRIAKREDELEGATKIVDKAKTLLSWKSTSFQNAQSEVNKFNTCMKSKSSNPALSCGNEEWLKENENKKYKEMEAAKDELSEALSNYEYLRDLIKKLKNALKKLLSSDGPKPSVEPRAKSPRKKTEPTNQSWR